MIKIYSNLNCRTRKITPQFIWVILLCMATVFNSYGQVPFSPRTSKTTPSKEVYSIRGDFAMMGNTNLTLVSKSETDSNEKPMEFVNVDPMGVDANNRPILNSSSATLNFSNENSANPSCSEIIYAGLYWTGRADNGTDLNEDGDNDPNTFNAANEKPLDKTKVLLKVPGGTYTTVEAEGNLIEFPTNNESLGIFVGYAEVTDLVKNSKDGEYTVADIALNQGTIDAIGLSGGWGMVVVYENFEMNWRDITVFDGYAFVGVGDPDGVIEASGFNTPTNGPVNLKLGVMASEGEANKDGDFFAIEQRNSGNFIRLKHDLNETDNFFNSSIFTHENLGYRKPELKNNAGLDIAVFNLENDDKSIIDNEQNSTKFKYGLGDKDDSFVIFNVTFAVDLNSQPSLMSTPNPLEVEGCYETDLAIKARYAYNPDTPIDITDTFLDDPDYKIFYSGTIASITYIDKISTVPSSNCVEIIRTFTAMNGCGNTATAEQLIVITPTKITYAPPSDADEASCDFNDQTEVDTAFSNWVTQQSNAIAVTDGCSTALTNNGDSLSAPMLCDGGSTTVTWTITSLCETITLTADFNLAAAPAITYTEPSDADEASCDFNDQTEVDTAFSNWVTQQSNAIAVTDGCSTVLTNNGASLSAPMLCDGGSTTVTWTIISLCETITLTADFNLAAAPEVTYTEPNHANTLSCDFIDQTEVDTAFSNWVTQQSNAIAVTDGCSTALTNNGASLSAPMLCDGGSTTVTWTITSLCETITLTADFNLAAAPEVTYTLPSDTSSTASQLYDPDPTIAQANLDGDIAAWILTQTNTIKNSIEGGCYPEISNNFSTQSISFCASNSITITWTVNDLCSTTSPQATYTFIQPDGIDFNYPDSKIVESCQFDNLNIGVAQNALHADIAAWVTAQTNLINGSLSEGSPVITNDFENRTLDFCTGGILTVEWNIEDVCETLTPSATYTLKKPETVNYTPPIDKTMKACDFDITDPATVEMALNNAISDWVMAQTDIISTSITGGCSPKVTHDFNNASISFCEDGSVLVTWTIEDSCEITQTQATFTFTNAEVISYAAPTDNIVDACSFDSTDPATAQTALNNAITTWIAAQTNIISSSLSGGCSPTIMHDFNNEFINFCEGGATVITWTIKDICETKKSTATYTLKKPGLLTYTAPVDEQVEACLINTVTTDLVTVQTDLNTAIATWVATQTNNINSSLSGGCSPTITHDFKDETIDFCSGGAIPVTWTIHDSCGTSTTTATYTLTRPDAVVYDLPANEATLASQFYDTDPAKAQANLDADIVAWVTAQTDAINSSIEGGCSPKVSNNYIDQTIAFCGSNTLTVTWTIQDVCGSTNATATYEFTQPEGLEFTSPSENIVEACQFDNPDIIIAQKALDADIAAWVNTQTDIINTSLSGGSPTVSNNYTNQSIDFCTGGFITITWEIEDVCQILNPTATYILKQPEPIGYTRPINKTAFSCEFYNQNPLTAQANVKADIIAWVSAQTNTIANSITGGCSPTITHNYTDQSIAFCLGGSVSVIWTVEDLCETTTETATYTLTKPNEITYKAPENTSSTACKFDNSTPEKAQAALNADISTWVNTQTNLLENSFNGGCSPSVTNDFVQPSLTFCSSGSLTVNWTIQDICETKTASATYTFIAPTKVKFNQASLPKDLTVACDAIPNPVALSASTSCGSVKVTYNQDRFNGSCINSYVLRRTWKAIDVCGTQIAHVQEITVQDTKAPELITNYDSLLTVSCTEIPEVPLLTFTDNCSTNIDVTFNETNSFNENVYADYKIIRTWTVADACGNSKDYTQELNVMLDEIVTEITAGDQCFDDGIIDLNQFLSGEKNNGNWELIEGKTEATLTASIFDPTVLEFAEDFLPGSGGINYLFRYTGLENGCINSTEVTINIHADCAVLPCGSQDVVISTALTPNGDNQNETFDIGGIELCGFKAEVKVFNRWGAIVYESNEYQIGEGLGSWAGKSNSASMGASGTVPNGTYYYIVNIKDNTGIIGTYTGPVYIGTK
ncbi:gliding motility-associated C-terminal domain-containing protein [Mariniflexile ostreae]|uniref:Gliding motility-associated C-terminal domain-containing protein n=1 Tax=Mariniflexile ostreae TaxID=1520892 RepID=A0ABV5FAW3_9FLAO